MKQHYFFMSLLIPGPKGPGNDIDVFLRPLIDELKDLWEIVVYTYDTSTQENFQMRVAIMWTINDFPAYAYTSSWSTQGHLACPCCAMRLSIAGYQTVKRHVIWIIIDFIQWTINGNYRRHSLMIRERKGAPKRLFGDDVLKQINGLPLVIFGKVGKQQGLDERGKSHNWKKPSVFFDLPY